MSNVRVNGNDPPWVYEVASRKSVAIEEIWVNSATGDDRSGTGSSGSPYATLQRAWDSIPQRGSASLYFQINAVGAGPYTFPVMDKLPASGAYVTFVGDRTGADTVSVPNSFAATGTNNVRQTVNAGAYAFTVNNETHWLELDYGIGSAFPPWGGSICPSTTPNIDAPPARYGFTANMVARPFVTTVNLPQGAYVPGVAGPDRPRSGDGVAFVGFVVTSSNARPVIRNVAFAGCRFDPQGTHNWVFDACQVDGAFADPSAAVNVYFRNGCDVRGSVIGHLSGVHGLIAIFGDYGLNTSSSSSPNDNNVCANNVFIARGELSCSHGRLSFGAADFEGSGNPCFGAGVDSIVDVVLLGNDRHTVSASRTTYMNALGGKVRFNTATGAVVGSVISDGFSLTDNAFVSGLYNAVSGGLTAGGVLVSEDDSSRVFPSPGEKVGPLLAQQIFS